MYVYRLNHNFVGWYKSMYKYHIYRLRVSLCVWVCGDFSPKYLWISICSKLHLFAQHFQLSLWFLNSQVHSLRKVGVCCPVSVLPWQPVLPAFTLLTSPAFHSVPCPASALFCELWSGPYASLLERCRTFSEEASRCYRSFQTERRSELHSVRGPRHAVSSLLTTVAVSLLWVMIELLEPCDSVMEAGLTDPPMWRIIFKIKQNGIWPAWSFTHI